MIAVYPAEVLERIAYQARDDRFVEGFTSRQSSAVEVSENIERLKKFFEHFDIPYTGPYAKADGTYFYPPCPWADHSGVTPHGGVEVAAHSMESNGTDTAVRVNPAGYAFICMHSHGPEVHWADFRRHHDPELTFAFVEELSPDELERLIDKWGAGLEDADLPEPEFHFGETHGLPPSPPCSTSCVIPDPSERIAEFDAKVRANVNSLRYEVREGKGGREIRKARPKHEVSLDITRFLLRVLRHGGRTAFLSTQGRFFFYCPVRESLYPFDSAAFKAQLVEWDLPYGRDREGEIADLESLIAAQQTAPVPVFPLFHYEPVTYKLFVNIRNKRLLVLTPHGWSTERMGFDNVWMWSSGGGLPEECLAHMGTWPGWGLKITNSILCQILRVKYELESDLTQEDFELLFLAKMVCGCLPEMSKRKVICALTSNKQAAGKTFQACKPGWLYEGESFKPTNVSAKQGSDQMETLLTQKGLVVADNIDRATQISQSLLCMAATNGVIVKRAHYKNFDLAEAPLVADLYLTALQLPSYAADVMSRILHLKIAMQEQDGLSETAREEYILANRSAMLGELLSRLQGIVRDEKRAAEVAPAKGTFFKTQFRVKDFGLFLLRQAALYGEQNRVQHVLDKLAEDQEASSVENSSLLPICDHIIVHLVEPTSRKQNSTKLFMSFKQHWDAMFSGTKFIFEDGRALSRYVNANLAQFERAYGLRKSKQGNNPVYYFAPTPEQVATAKERLGCTCSRCNPNVTGNPGLRPRSIDDM